MPGLKVPGLRRAVLAGSAVVGLAGGVLLGTGLSAGGAEPAGPGAPGTSAAPLADTPPAPDGAVVAPDRVPAAGTTPSSAVHVRVPAVHLDLPVLPLAAAHGVIDPPLLTAAYWIQPYGRPVGSPGEARNTLYLAAHSAGRGSDGFDPLLTADHRSSALHPGDTVEVSTPEGTVTYTVQRTAHYGKDQLAGAADVWQAVPGRLVLVTCLKQGRAWTENLVVFAAS